MQTIAAPPAAVPVAVLQSLLRAHLADQAAVITEATAEPLPHQGTNDSTSFSRIALSWSSPWQSSGPGAATWIIKHWRAGGRRDGAMGIGTTREVLAWEQGLLRPAALPPGLVVPIVGARRSPDGTEAWLALEEVSTELAAYPRFGLSPDQALARIRLILARLARFHALWEAPERQAALRACAWLGQPEAVVWGSARAYALALGRAPVAHLPPAVAGPPDWPELGADLEAFLAHRPSGERPQWERLLIDRRALMEALTPYPPTLLHNDLDDRNIGLRLPDDEATPAGEDAPALVLIDWEWLTLGPAALDVAKVIAMLSVVMTPGSPLPEAGWNDELAGAYFADYRAAGGRFADPAGWRRALGLASVAHGLAQLPAVHGSLLRAVSGERELPELAGIPAEVARQHLRANLPQLEQLGDLVIGEARRWLG